MEKPKSSGHIVKNLQKEKRPKVLNKWTNNSEPTENENSRNGKY